MCIFRGDFQFPTGVLLRATGTEESRKDRVIDVAFLSHLLVSLLNESSAACFTFGYPATILEHIGSLKS